MIVKLIETLFRVDNLAIPHRARVLDNRDPRRLGRIKVGCQGLFEGPTKTLPWVYPLQAFSLGGSRTSGFSVPEIGTYVVVEFPYNNIYFPVYIGFYQSLQTHQPIFDGEHSADAAFPNTNNAYGTPTYSPGPNPQAVGLISHPEGSTFSTNNPAIDTDGPTPPPFYDPDYQSETSLAGLDATTDRYVVVPTDSGIPLGTHVLLRNNTNGKTTEAIVGDHGPAFGEMSLAAASDLGIWEPGQGNSALNHDITATFVKDPALTNKNGTVADNLPSDASVQTDAGHVYKAADPPGVKLADEGEDYPDIYGHSDSTGNIIKVNKKKGYVHIKHGPSGTTLDIDKEGNLTLTLNKNGDTHLNIPGNLNINTEKDVNWRVGGNFNQKIEGQEVKGVSMGTEVFGQGTSDSNYEPPLPEQ